MYSLETCAIITAYLASVGVALELSHRLYWRLSKRTLSLGVSAGTLSTLAAATACIPLAVAWLVTSVFTTFVSHKPMSAIGLTYDAHTASYILRGALVALGCVMFAFFVGVVAGHIRVKRWWLQGDARKAVPEFVEGLVAFLSGAMFEELVFRGYVFYILHLHYGSAVAVVVSSLLFSTAHLIKHKRVPILFTVNAFIFGLLAAICRHQTGGLWLPIGLHFGWNVVSGSILGLPYSGKSFDSGIVACEVSGPAWLTGGLNSLDAGLLGTAALLVAAVGLLTFVPLF